MKLLPGSYKGTRKFQPPPVIIRIACPGCNWTVTARFEEAEKQYLRHITEIHDERELAKSPK